MLFSAMTVLIGDVNLNADLSETTFKPCGSFEAQSIGFVPPVAGEESCFHTVGGATLMSIQIEQKILPGSALNLELKKRLKFIEESQGFAPGRKQTREIKDALRDEMLARAFSKHDGVRIIFFEGYCFIGAAGKRFEDALTLLIKSKVMEKINRFSSTVEAIPREKFTNWLTMELPDGIGGGDSAKWIEDDTKAVYSLKDGHIDDQADAILKNGAKVTQLGLVIDDVSFVLDECLTFKRIKSAKVADEDDSHITQIDADIVLTAGICKQLVEKIAEEMVVGNAD